MSPRVSLATPVSMRLAISVLTALNAASTSHSLREEIRAGLPKYEPTIRENHLARQEATRRAADN